MPRERWPAHIAWLEDYRRFWGRTLDRLATLMAELFAHLLDGHNAHLSDGVQQALGRTPRDFSAFARAAAARGVWGRADVTEELRDARG